MAFEKALWISSGKTGEQGCPVFVKKFQVKKNIRRALLDITARGVYRAELNSKRIGNFVLAPGWTVYDERLQYQTYDITGMLGRENVLEVTLAPGWYAGRISGGEGTWHDSDPKRHERVMSLIAELRVDYVDGSTEIVPTDTDWPVGEGGTVFSDIYDGEIYDARKSFSASGNAVESENHDKSMLIPTEGEIICEHERIKGRRLIITPRGERVIDFGQNLTGYPEFTVNAAQSEHVDISFAEILDENGNFYTENYRSARCMLKYTCKDGKQTYKPSFTFYGFRYIRIDSFPDGKLSPDDFTAIAVYSDMKRIGHFHSSDEMLNRLYSNIVWGQKSNYLDVPTDCPQRDERFGYTGDAQVFIKAGCKNFDTGRFFKKWLADVICTQTEDGAVEAIAPAVYGCRVISAGWGDAITVIPWELYLAYGDKTVLSMAYPAMKRWISYIEAVSTSPNEWTGGHQFGDWLEITDGEKGSDKELIATAFFANSCMLTYKAGKALGESGEEYLKKYNKIKRRFIEKYEPNVRTQTEHCLTLAFGLTDRSRELAASLYDRVIADGRHLTTGFLGTPFLPFVLTDYGYDALAYELLLRREFPSWLYGVTRGATTMWERWDSVKPDGAPADAGMNSFNHYAYGAVGAWLYEKAAGICTSDEHPGYESVLFHPHVTDRLDGLSAEIETRHGTVSSSWRHENGKTVYEFVSPGEATAIINGEKIKLNAGKSIIIK